MYILLVLLGLTTTSRTTAQTADNAELEQLQQEMYRYYSTNEVEKFTNIVEQLKAKALQAGDERLFYKAWANLSTYSFSHVSRQKGLDLCLEMRNYAQEHDSKFGLYTSTFANAHMLTNLKQYVLAEKNYQNCIEYLNRYFPDESTAAIYLSLAKICQNNDETEKVREYAQKVLDDPHATDLYKLNAMSYICLTYSQLDGRNLEQFNRAYEERQKMKEKIGQEGFFGLAIDFEHALLNGDYDKAIALIDKMSPLEQKRMKVRVYEKMGDYKEALQWYKRYRDHRDSVNVASVRQQSSEYAVELDVARAESEAKDLRLTNQELLLRQTQNQLEQQRLETEAADLKLKNQQIALENATMQLENATLDGKAKELELREALLEMEAEQQARKTRRLTRVYLYAAIAVAVAALAFFLWRRQRQMKRLKGINQQLQQAYDRLEKTTSAKERIESELRIARDIQMSMVPSDFPHRPDLDIAAYMKPAKEVGGDLYNYVLLDDDTLYFCIGDVSGKGVPASLFMAQATRLFRSQAMLRQLPANIANHMNAELAESNEQGMFVTMFIGMANLRTGRLDFCNCGHNPPVLDRQFMTMESNAPIGLWPGLEFVGEHVDDIRQKRLFIYTDGLNEAEDTWQTQFGDKLILALLQGHPAYDCRQTIDMFVENVADFVGDAEPSDDLTLLCIKLTKKK